MATFRQLGIHEHLLDIVEKLGFTEPTEIQEKAIPPGIAGRDIIAQSATGSGKTLAFAAAFIHKTEKGKGIQVLILTPTRELADQDAKAIRTFSSHKRLAVAEVIGGLGFNPQVDALKTAEVVVATPGRLLDHLTQGTVRLSGVKVLILDEADRMFDMGFIRDVERIMGHCPRDRQTMLFSATINEEVMRIAERHMRNPVSVEAENFVDPSKLKQVFYAVGDFRKFSLLVHLIKKEHSGLVMVFCNTRRNVDRVQRNLELNGIKSQAIHGGLTQSKRGKVISDFHASAVQVLVCTDVAARGLDIKGVQHVYNYDIPSVASDYVHRIGRTARAGEAGRAISLVGESDRDNFRQVMRSYDFDLVEERAPDVPDITLQRVKGRGGGGGERRGSWAKSSGSNRGGGFRQRREGGSDERRGGRRDEGGSGGRGGGGWGARSGRRRPRNTGGGSEAFHPRY